jgi:hypothetical protein
MGARVKVPVIILANQASTPPVAMLNVSLAKPANLITRLVKGAVVAAHNGKRVTLVKLSAGASLQVLLRRYRQQNLQQGPLLLPRVNRVAHLRATLRANLLDSLLSGPVLRLLPIILLDSLLAHPLVRLLAPLR